MLFCKYKFRDQYDVGHVVTLALGQVVTFIAEQIVCVVGVNRANCDLQSIKLGM